MLYYLTSARQSATMAFYLGTWGRALADRVRIFAYEALAQPGYSFPIRDGVYVFAALDGGLGSRNPPSDKRLKAAGFHDQLVRAVGARKVLNHPLRSLGRYDLLKALRQRGINDFDACRLGERPGPHRFPVYVRKEVSSGSQEPPLLGSREYQDLNASAPAGDDRIAIEFCDTADANGVYRKYGALALGGEIVPRHLFRSRSWFCKQADLDGAEWTAEELAYLESDAHAATMREVCRIAGIGYGRIDYSLKDGRPQVWEINHTPELVFADANWAADPRAQVHRRFTELFIAALDRLENS